jgi:Ca-activated chloride channel family protein
MKRIKFLAFSLVVLFCSCEDSSLNSSFVGDIFEGSFAGDQYNEYGENQFIETENSPISTFSIDADGASYANTRRFIQQDQMIPPVGAVRTEELINYFNLEYNYSDTSHPINLNGEISTCPWNPENKLIRIGIKGKNIPLNELPPSNFVLLIDVSGSMGSEDKLELLKSGFKDFVDQTSANDKIAIVTYAGSAGLVLPSTLCTNKQVIKNAIDTLGSGGSTAGAEGIITAYDIALENLVENGNNRIILGTDGDFNVGISNQEELINLIEEKRNQGIFLTVLGVGRGNLNDGTLEQIANKGNGTYEYIDTIEQLRKVFIYDYNKFFAVAKDVKVQVVFNPSLIESYRLIGYENRVLDTEDFEDDTEDAGEIGANQNITALYEIISTPQTELLNEKAFTIDVRYKLPNLDISTPLTLDIYDTGNTFDESSDYMKFTASVASFAMLLTDSSFKGNSSYSSIQNWLSETSLSDPYGFKSQFQDIVEIASSL